ncbi:ABCA9 [Scenedesmus sp. PABB004]|nr:ABCA9 [Scenedesmus sp. PABB004]
MQTTRAFAGQRAAVPGRARCVAVVAKESRIGMKPVPIPKGVTIDLKGSTLKVKGPKGELQWTFVPEVVLSQDADQLLVRRAEETKRASAMHGLSRSLASNMVVGVSAGFERRMEMVGTGYRASVAGKELTLNVGYSKPRVLAIPEGLTVKVEKNTQLTFTGADKVALGAYCAEVRRQRPPEPYKGKGIRYEGEFIKLKEGKGGGKKKAGYFMPATAAPSFDGAALEDAEINHCVGLVRADVLRELPPAMGQPRALLDRVQRHKGVRQTGALFVKNVLVAWRNRWATAIRLLAPLLFLALALLVQEVMGVNARRTGRIRDAPVSEPVGIGPIPACSSELFIHTKPCLDFIYTPNDTDAVQAIVSSIQRNNDPPIPDARVMGFASRADADAFIQSRERYVLGAVHFSEGPNSQLQYVLQTNTSTPTFKGYVQGPNDFFQLPFMSAVAREVARHYLASAGRADEAARLAWAPRTAIFPHPQLSAGTAGYVLPPFIFVACMFATISHLAALVSEKESGLRQALQTMGLQQGSYWLSWWLFEAAMAAVTAWAIIGFGVALRLDMFVTNDVGLLFVLFWLFGVAMSSFTCCVSVFLSTAQSASNAGLGIVLVGWVCQALGVMGLPFAPSIFYTSNGMGKAFFWIFALFPWNPLTKGVLDMSAAATHPVSPGLRFSQRSSYCRYVPDPAKATAGNMTWLYMENNCIYSIEQCFATLLVQAVAWAAAAVYFDSVRPDRHGVARPPWYPLLLLGGRWPAALLRAAGRAVGLAPRGGGGAAAGGKARSGAGGARTPFAASDVNRKAAKSITDAKEGELVIRCSSSPGAGGAGEPGRGAPLDAPAGSVGSSHRHSVSSGFLRRRDHRASSAAGEAGAAAGEPGAARSASGHSTLGRLPVFPPQQHSQQLSQQLMVQPSVTVLRLSDASSEAHSGVGFAGGAAAAPGATISLAAYQQQLAAARAGGRRWWQFWRGGATAEGGGAMLHASRKHGSMVAAAGAAGPGGAGRDGAPPGGFGMVPVVLDPGVLQEEQRMKAAWYSDADAGWTPKQDTVQVFGLRKVYKLPARGAARWWPFGARAWRGQGGGGGGAQQRPQQFVAVADSWFGVPKGQLLCLLGPNGAGKTTSINCLIGALPPSGGDIRVMGHSLLTPDGLAVAQAAMGVCPQFDVLWDELSGREHMYIYGCIKGLPSHEVAEQGAALLEQVQLTPAAGKRSSSYSGGMKRRLSVALALLGQPQLVYLDEPSTGMDPISRRAVWDAINAAKSHAAIVLTTHSMEVRRAPDACLPARAPCAACPRPAAADRPARSAPLQEADALGDRIGIMVRGRMRVLGGSLTLKQKYGNGYQLRMRLKDAAPPPPPDPWGQLQQHAAECQLAVGGGGSDGGARHAGLQSVLSGGAAAAGPPAALGGAPPPPPPPSPDGGTGALQELVAGHLGLAPTEEGRGMLHYVIPAGLAPALQALLEALDDPAAAAALGLAEVHVSLASLEEVFLAVVKQAEQDHAAAHGHTVLVELPDGGGTLEVPVGQEAAADPASGEVYAVEWAQDEWGKLAVLGVRRMELAEQQRYWQHRHVQPAALALVVAAGASLSLGAAAGPVLTVSPSVYEVNGQNVTVSWSGIAQARATDSVALVVTSAAEFGSRYPLNYVWIGESSPGTIETGAGSTRFWVPNLRRDLTVVYLRYKSDGPGAAWGSQSVIASATLAPSPALRSAPHQLRLSLLPARAASSGGTEHGQPEPVTVQFAWQSVFVGGEVLMSTSEAALRAALRAITANLSGWTDPGYTNAASLRLAPATRYVYAVGSPQGGYSGVRSFTTPPAAGGDHSGGGPLRMLLAADNGKNNMGDGSWVADGQGFSVLDALQAAAGPLPPGRTLNPATKYVNSALARAAATGNYHAALFVGDLAYAEGVISAWDRWLTQLEPVFSTVPTNFALGNHEAAGAGLPQGAVAQTFQPSNGGGECGVPYQAKLRMPLASGVDPTVNPRAMWYWYTVGPVAFVVLSTEQDWSPGSTQYTWLDATLAEVSAARAEGRLTWLLVAFHRPMYVDDADQSPDGNYAISDSIRAAWEPLLFKYQADLVLAGHVHMYTRSHPVAKGAPVPPSGGVSAPTHITLGNAGYQVDAFALNVTPPWVAVESWHYGACELEASQGGGGAAALLSVRCWDAADGSIVDEFSLTKPEGWRPASPAAAEAYYASLPTAPPLAGIQLAAQVAPYLMWLAGPGLPAILQYEFAYVAANFGTGFIAQLFAAAPGSRLFGLPDVVPVYAALTELALRLGAHDLGPTGNALAAAAAPSLQPRRGAGAAGGAALRQRQQRPLPAPARPRRAPRAVAAAAADPAAPPARAADGGGGSNGSGSADGGSGGGGGAAPPLSRQALLDLGASFVRLWFAGIAKGPQAVEDGLGGILERGVVLTADGVRQLDDAHGLTQVLAELERAHLEYHRSEHRPMLYAASAASQRVYALVEGRYQDVGALPGHPATFRRARGRCAARPRALRAARRDADADAARRRAPPRHHRISQVHHILALQVAPGGRVGRLWLRRQLTEEDKDELLHAPLACYPSPFPRESLVLVDAAAHEAAAARMVAAVKSWWQAWSAPHAGGAAAPREQQPEGEEPARRSLRRAPDPGLAAGHLLAQNFRLYDVSWPHGAAGRRARARHRPPAARARPRGDDAAAAAAPAAALAQAYGLWTGMRAQGRRHLGREAALHWLQQLRYGHDVDLQVLDVAAAEGALATFTHWTARLSPRWPAPPPDGGAGAGAAGDAPAGGCSVECVEVDLFSQPAPDPAAGGGGGAAGPAVAAAAAEPGGLQLSAIWMFRGPIGPRDDTLFLSAARGGGGTGAGAGAAARGASPGGAGANDEVATRAARRAAREAQLEELVAWMREYQEQWAGSLKHVQKALERQQRLAAAQIRQQQHVVTQLSARYQELQAEGQAQLAALEREHPGASLDAAAAPPHAGAAPPDGDPRQHGGGGSGSGTGTGTGSGGGAPGA